jgi:ketosteroid isomerase-like protein
MKKIVSSILFLLSIQITIAQSKQEKEVAISVEQLRIAMVNADSYGHSGGAIDDKKIFIEKFVSGKSDFVTINLTEQTITVTKKIAIVRHTLTATTNDSGKPGTVNLKVLQVWHKQKGHWLFIARQAIKIQL